MFFLLQEYVLGSDRDLHNNQIILHPTQNDEEILSCTMYVCPCIRVRGNWNCPNSFWSVLSTKRRYSHGKEWSKCRPIFMMVAWLLLGFVNRIGGGHCMQGGGNKTTMEIFKELRAMGYTKDCMEACVCS